MLSELLKSLSAESTGFSLETWEDTKAANYNLDVEYEHQILPLIKEIKERCTKVGIPYVMVFQISSTEEHNKMATFAQLKPLVNVGTELLNVYRAGESSGLDLVMNLATNQASSERKSKKGNL